METGFGEMPALVVSWFVFLVDVFEVLFVNASAPFKFHLEDWKTCGFCSIFCTWESSLLGLEDIVLKCSILYKECSVFKIWLNFKGLSEVFLLLWYSEAMWFCRLSCARSYYQLGQRGNPPSHAFYVLKADSREKARRRGGLWRNWFAPVHIKQASDEDEQVISLMYVQLLHLLVLQREHGLQVY